MLALLAAVQTGDTPLPVPVDLTVAGLLLAAVSALLRLWWIERRDRQTAEAALLELTGKVIETTANNTAALDRSTDALRLLTDEVRRAGERR